MNTPVIQLGILGLSANSAPAAPAAPGVFAKVLTGAMQSSGPASNADGSLDQSAASRAGSGTTQNTAILLNGPKTSSPVVKFNNASKNDPEPGKERTSVALPDIPAPVVQNPPVVQSLPLNESVASGVKAKSETLAANQVTQALQGGSERLATVDTLAVSPWLLPPAALTATAVKPAIGNAPATKTAESISENASVTNAVRPALENTSTTDTMKPVLGNASTTNPMEPSFGNAPTTRDDKTGLMPETSAPVGDPSTSTPFINGEKPAPSEKISGGEFQVPKKLTEKTGSETDIALRTLPGQANKAPTNSGLTSGNDNPQTTRSTTGTAGSDTVHAAAASASPAMKQPKEMQAALEFRANSPIATDGRPATDAVAIRVMVSPPSSADLTKGNTGNASKSPLPAVGKNSQLQVTSTAKAAVSSSGTNEPQTNLKDANKVHKPESVSQSGLDKGALPVRDVTTNPPDTASTKVSDADRSQSVPVTSKPAASAQDLPKSGSQANAAGLPISGAHDADASEAANPFPGTLVNSAKLIERIGHTEMRVGIQGGDLGNVDIRTALGKHQFTAEISVERGELGRVMTSELPALHSRLSEQQVPFPRVTIQEYSSGSSSNLEQRSREERRAPQTNSMPREESSRESGPGMFDAMSATEANQGSGIDLHM